MGSRGPTNVKGTVNIYRTGVFLFTSKFPRLSAGKGGGRKEETKVRRGGIVGVLCGWSWGFTHTCPLRTGKSFALWVLPPISGRVVPQAFAVWP